MEHSLVTARPVTRVLAVVMAASALVGGYAHLKLYNDGYKDIPVGNIGRQFLLNAVGAVAIAVGLLLVYVVRVLPTWIGKVAAAAGVVWGAISLVAFFVARTSGGWFGFTDQPGLNPSPEAALAVFAEATTIALGVAVLVVDVISGSAPGRRRRHA
jgi:hypothetical protein